MPLVQTVFTYIYCTYLDESERFRQLHTGCQAKELLIRTLAIEENGPESMCNEQVAKLV